MNAFHQKCLKIPNMHTVYLHRARARWEWNQRCKTCFHKSLTQCDYQPNPHIPTHTYHFVLFLSQTLLLGSSKHAQETCESLREVINFIWVFGYDGPKNSDLSNLRQLKNNSVLFCMTVASPHPTVSLRLLIMHYKEQRWKICSHWLCSLFMFL